MKSGIIFGRKRVNSENNFDKETSSWEGSAISALNAFANERFLSCNDEYSGFWGLVNLNLPSSFDPEHKKKREVAANFNISTNELSKKKKVRKKFTFEAQISKTEVSVARLRKSKKALAIIYSNLDFDRPNPQGPVCISKHDTHSAPQIIIDEQSCSLQNLKGYCMSKATHGADKGTFYYEISLLIDRGHLRAGWSQILGDPQAPVGYDEYSYGIRDSDGCIIHTSRPKEYGVSFHHGDILGCMVHLPEYIEHTNNNELKDKIEKEYPPLREGVFKVSQNVLQAGWISFYVNGECLGKAFSPIYRGKYYPAISLFGGCKVQVNFGPDFVKPPKDIEYLPICDLK